MDVFIKAVAGLLICSVLGVFLQKSNKDFSLLLILISSVMAAIAAMHYFLPVLEFFRELVTVGDLDPALYGILLKALGIGILAELAALVCSDAGNASGGKVLQILGCAVIVWISIPLFDNLLSLIREILGGL